MSEIKCPKCNEVFTVDESGYIAIVEQVKNSEFQKELKEREELIKLSTIQEIQLAKLEVQKELDQTILASDTKVQTLVLQLEDIEKDRKNQLQLADVNAKANLDKSLVESNQKIEKLRVQLATIERDRDTKLELAEVNAKAILEKNLVHSKQEIEKLRVQLEIIEKDKTSKLELADVNAQAALDKSVVESNKEIDRLNNLLISSQKEKDSELEIVEAKAKVELQKLEGALSRAETEKTLAIQVEVSKVKEQLSTKDQQILELKLKDENTISTNELRIKSIEDGYKNELLQKDKTIDFYKDFKAKQSTKMLGETLEQHCEIAFNQIRPAGFQNAYFEKDNDSRTGSKGDFIFKEETENGVEFISIMFEMKNEMDTTATKKKNEDFFKELDKDRNEKKCEYAVLVSLLESDSDYYNSGIVDVSHKYPKMYVIRPQFFIPLITLLRNAAKNSAHYREQLVEVQSQNIDISNFEDQMKLFKDSFGKNVQWASDRFKNAIDDIDKTIKLLEKTKTDLTLSAKHLNSANDKAQDLSIKKLTKGNPTMIEKFAEIENKITE